jgi:hypothetical protein
MYSTAVARRSRHHHAPRSRAARVAPTAHQPLAAPAAHRPSSYRATQCSPAPHAPVGAPFRARRTGCHPIAQRTARVCGGIAGYRNHCAPAQAASGHVGVVPCDALALRAGYLGGKAPRGGKDKHELQPRCVHQGPVGRMRRSAPAQKISAASRRRGGGILSSGSGAARSAAAAAAAARAAAAAARRRRRRRGLRCATRDT